MERKECVLYNTHIKITERTYGMLRTCIGFRDEEWLVKD